MNDAVFNRGLKEGFVEALNAAYGGDNGWWRNLADDPEIFIAVRGGYLNAYYKGNSLMRLDLKDGKPRGSVHYKYLLKPTLKPEYVTIADGKPVPGKHDDVFLSDLSDVVSLKKAATPYTGIEKAGVHEIIKKNPNVIDVEIAFGSNDGEAGKATAPRLDFAALQEGPDHVHLAFFEAKHFSNKELRASSEKPLVLNQIDRYADLVKMQAGNIHDAYLRVFEHLQTMQGRGLRNPVRDKLMALALSKDKPLAIDWAPRLVIFGFDNDQRTGAAWSPHLAKLKAALGDRLLCKGNANEFTSGISA